MAKAKKKWPVMPPILKAGFPRRFPEECGTIASTDKKTQSLSARAPKGSKQRKYHGQQAK